MTQKDDSRNRFEDGPKLVLARFQPSLQAQFEFRIGESVSQVVRGWPWFRSGFAADFAAPTDPGCLACSGSRLPPIGLPSRRTCRASGRVCFNSRVLHDPVVLGRLLFRGDGLLRFDSAGRWPIAAANLTRSSSPLLPLDPRPLRLGSGTTWSA
jgi:hypothetical protein